jgi:NADH-quinone oxidoreductase subunit C
MPLSPAITDIDQLQSHPALARLVGWNRDAIQAAKFDREEMTVVVDRSALREACSLLQEDPACPFNFLSDITCVDWYPAEPRFEVIYHLLSISKKERVRLKVRLEASSPVLDSITTLWPGANYFEREVYDLFGVRFAGHPNLQRILMPEDWEGYPLRKDYPVEGYR